MSKNLKTFFRTVYISSVIMLCIFIAFYGISSAYVNIRRIGFGEYRNAIEITDTEIKLFDFKIER